MRAAYAPASTEWRRFELKTRVTLDRDGASAQAWIPVPAHADPLWTIPGDTTWTGNADTVKQVMSEDGSHGFIHATWDASDTPAVLEVTSDVRTRDRHSGLSGTAALSEEERARATTPTELLPLNGIVLDTANEITDGADNDLDKAKRIYNWVVDETERNPETRGCGLGDIASMLHTGDLTGKCADLNALFVGLARAAGLPARDLYGIRVAPSAFGYKALGAGSADVTKAQHCRAEVFIDGHGWVAADPADVRKVVLQEDDGTLSLSDAKVQDVRDALFGAAEGNWIALGTAHDVSLPGSDNGPVPFLMYPQAEIGGERRDELDPANFTYTITTRELDA
ncbi:predicted Transglutaminase-like enzyme, putative cysteine protease [Sagittula stellata E-37]|uniref:Predicted Transglutaminase-like enzyme, putative cysteine protease n=1 Tax=Sagittula stellata (strain ATCC 700073 / DSM 11524 / E-37) TaxID=388399 RepID=A3JYU9_SAGS3|nr:predicted Transglutaminase-like enzyme, putative cysteine protease [Sagittula stellata E-37]